MIFTPLDRLMNWFSNIWRKIDAMKSPKDKYALTTYILGLVGVTFQLPAVYLVSYVFGKDLLDLHNLRFYAAVSVWAMLMYFVGGAYSLRQYRKLK